MHVDTLIDDILEKEGGYVNHPADRGGPTNYGITQDTYSAYLGRTATIDDMKNMTKRTAKSIYIALYYKKPRINELPEAVQPIVLDMAVNSGPVKAVMMLQQVLDRLGYKLAKIDGLIGPATIKATTTAVDQLGSGLIRQIVNRRLAFYRGIVKKNPTQKVFLAGWERRATSFLI